MENQTETSTNYHNLPNKKAISSSSSPGSYLPHDGVEMRSFRSYLRWIYVDQSNICRAALSWSLFFFLAFAVPLLSHFLLACSSTCDADHTRPYHIPVQISLSVLATLSFLSLSRWDRKYGIRKFLSIDKVGDESPKIRRGYAEQLQKTMKLILIWGLPCFLAECGYKIWWYSTGSHEIPYYGDIYISNITLCMIELLSWLYRTSIFFLVCVLFRLICHLQILRLEDFAQVFQKETEVGSILVEHLTMRRNLSIISHRFRGFILASLILVTASQLIFLLLTTKTGADVDILKAGELVLVSVTLVSGLFIMLRSATKITHKAQSVASLAAKWHMFCTINSFDNIDNNNGETQQVEASTQAFATSNTATWGSDEEVGDEEDELDNTKLLPIFTRTISFHKRQALVVYMENNRAGITMFGFMLDRMWLHSIFAIQLALCLSLLNKTIGV
ncbi:uncharacterized protein LOC129306749 [Prosopis cineraria]|uniref:uncharacterized protein LOC129306749 n=1 Tax=Prosopis cineraria TaxID=364024 RepID=UPI00240FBCE8|nr:uncharacterized protein LOC129306749 [Prosopis cineraria]